MSRAAHVKPHRTEMRRFWTKAEDRFMRNWYRKLGKSIAVLLGRSERSIYMRADSLKLRQKIHLSDSERMKLLTLIKSLHPLGHSDAEIADEWEKSGGMKICRECVGVHRRLLRLRHNAYSKRRRNRVAAKTREQLQAAGLASMAELRVKAFGLFARDHGWPEDLRPRAVQILDALFQHGPMTRRQIANAIGLPWKGSRKSLCSNDPEGSYLAHLQKRGMVVRLGRLIKGSGRGSSTNLYSLALNVAPRRANAAQYA